jgi:hypothetical protein
MALEDYGKDGIKALQKAGKAVLRFALVSSPDDKDFENKYLLADIYIVDADEFIDFDPEFDPLPDDCYIGTISKEEGHSCEVKVETFLNLVNRIKSGKKRVAKEVFIIVEPAREYSDKYRRNIYRRRFTSGREYPLKVTLQLKLENS